MPKTAMVKSGGLGHKKAPDLKNFKSGASQLISLKLFYCSFFFLWQVQKYIWLVFLLKASA